MIPDLLDRQWNSGIQRVELDHGREQGETLHVTVELARKQKRGLQDRRQEGILLGRNKNALHVVGRLTATLPCSNDITGLASVRVVIRAPLAAMWTLAKAHLHQRRLVVPLGHKRDLHSAGSIAVAGTWTPLGPTRSVTWMPHREDEGSKNGIHILDAGNENARAAAGPAARTLGAQSWRDPHHRVRAHAGDVPRRAQSDHRRHRPADHRARFSRFRTPAVDRYSIPAEFDRGRAAVRKAQRHLRAAPHDAREHRYLTPPPVPQRMT